MNNRLATGTRSAARKCSGVTLTQLLIVISIVGILAAIALPLYQQYAFRAKSAEVMVVLDKIKTVLALTQADRGAALGSQLVITEDKNAYVSQIKGANASDPGVTRLVPELTAANLTLERLGITIKVTSGFAGTEKAGQYKVTMFWPHGPAVATPEQQALAQAARQVVLAVIDAMEPFAYQVDRATVSGSLYLNLGGVSAAGSTQQTTITVPTVTPPTVSTMTPTTTPTVATPAVTTTLVPGSGGGNTGQAGGTQPANAGSSNPTGSGNPPAGGGANSQPPSNTGGGGSGGGTNAPGGGGNNVQNPPNNNQRPGNSGNAPGHNKPPGHNAVGKGHP